MKTQNTTYQQKKLALESMVQSCLEDSVQDCVHTILRHSRNEAEAKLGLATLQEVVARFQNREVRKPLPFRATDEIPGTEDIDLNELTEALMTNSEDDLLNKVFRGDKDAMNHFQDVRSGKHKDVSPQSKPVVAESKKPLVTENGKPQTHEGFERMKVMAGVKATEMTEAEKAKKEALEKGDMLFTPHVGFDGKLNFTGKFRRMENRHV